MISGRRFRERLTPNIDRPLLVLRKESTSLSCVDQIYLQVSNCTYTCLNHHVRASQRTMHVSKYLHVVYQVYKCEMRISDNGWCTGAVCAIKVWHRANLLCHQRVSDAHEWLIEKVCALCCVIVFNMSKFIPNKEHSRTALIFCLHLKKTAAESYWLLLEARGEHAPPQGTY